MTEIRSSDPFHLSKNKPFLKKYKSNFKQSRDPYKRTIKMNDIISPPSKWVSEMIARIEPGGTLIDIACGRGRHSIEFSKKILYIQLIKTMSF